LPNVLELGLDRAWQVPGAARAPEDRLGLSRGEEIDQATGVNHR
jgi:hypothetical protein